MILVTRTSTVTVLVVPLATLQKSQSETSLTPPGAKQLIAPRITPILYEVVATPFRQKREHTMPQGSCGLKRAAPKKGGRSLGKKGGTGQMRKGSTFCTFSTTLFFSFLKQSLPGKKRKEKKKRCKSLCSFLLTRILFFSFTFFADLIRKPKKQKLSRVHNEQKVSTCSSLGNFRPLERCDDDEGYLTNMIH